MLLNVPTINFFNFIKMLLMMSGFCFIRANGLLLELSALFVETFQKLLALIVLLLPTFYKGIYLINFY